MDIQLRPATKADADESGRIIYEAFKGIAEQHNFPPDFPSADTGIQFAQGFINDPNVFGVVAENNGRVVGSNFLSEWDTIRGVGPITIDPEVQARGVGRRLMQSVIERGRDARGVRLVQDAFNSASLSLYASLGFDVKEPLALVEGKIEGGRPSVVEVRPLRDDDLDEVTKLCERVHGFARTGEISALRPVLEPFVVLRDGRITGYTTAPGFWPLNHAVAESDEDMQALLSGTGVPLSFLLPIRQAKLFRWLLGQGLRVVKTMNLMTIGDYQEPRGSYLPSVLY